MTLNMYNLVLRKIRNYVVTSHCIRNRMYASIATNVQKKETSEPDNTKKNISSLAEFRFIYPEFLPDPKFEFRNKVREKLERSDMLKRRSVLYIPEFYVGSILAVTATDNFSPGKQKRFVGICIHRTYAALRATFTLRNIVDGLGVEIMYDLYNPTILSIDVLRLEKRLDNELFYLRDAPPEYSTFDFNMEPEFRPEGEPVPINTLKVKLKPWPWHVKWEQRNMKGIEIADYGVPLWKRDLARRVQKPWENYDLMKEYRRCIPEEDQVEIWQDLQAHKDKFPTKKHVWKRNLQKAPTK